MKYNIYLDDIRIPLQDDWILVKNYDEFVEKIKEINFNNIQVISLDHDLADEHYRPSMYDDDPEHYSKYYTDGTFKEKTGYDCAKFLIDYCMENNYSLPQIFVHSMNPVGGDNIVKLINNFYQFSNINRRCQKVQIPTKIL